MIDVNATMIAVLATVGWGILGVFMFALASRLYDFLDPIDYKVEIQRGNTAAAIKLGAVMLGIAAIIVAVIIG